MTQQPASRGTAFKPSPPLGIEVRFDKEHKLEFTPRSEPRKPRYRPRGGPDNIHGLYKSSKKCQKCGTDQSRWFEIKGPMTLEQCNKDHAGLPERKPRSASGKIARIPWLNLLAVELRPDKGWCVIEAEAYCDRCHEQHTEKSYRRQIVFWRIWYLRTLSRFLRTYRWAFVGY